MITMTMDFSGTLSLLSSMYLCKPTSEALASWKALLSGDIPDYLRDVKNAVDDIDLNSEQELEDLLWEYTRLFVGPYKLPCPPWESVYTSPKKLMMQDAYSGVRQLYEEAGLAINSPDVMADHIGMELNFLAVLFQKMHDEPGRRNYHTDIIERFVGEHVMKWVSRFAQDMKEAADSRFYKALAQITRDFIADMA
ncbi:MAG: molecular chaperone TorD family protein [Nitrospirae bacterium]|nr:molecular chaperone TorD family protein [Nitrospirota bacterium]